MQRRYNLARFILASIVVMVIVPLIVVVEAQAQIAFVSQRDGNPEIYVMDADGGNQQRLTNNPAKDWDPSWSPDGKQIAFVSDRDEHPHFVPGRFSYEIYVMDADGGNPRRLTNNPANDRGPAWSPDGKRIAFMSMRDGHIRDFAPTYEIYVTDADGGNPQNLTNNPSDDRYPSWSPDGKRIVFVSERPGHFRGDVGITTEIYVMDADGGNQQRLSENRQTDWFPSWSPDGERIVYAADRKGDFENFEIYVMDADGGNQQKLTNHRDYDWKPSWSPDGKRVAFMSERDGNAEIYVMDADGGNQQRLTNNREGDSSPAWFNPDFAIEVAPSAVTPAGKIFTIWGGLKQGAR